MFELSVQRTGFFFVTCGFSNTRSLLELVVVVVVVVVEMNIIMLQDHRTLLTEMVCSSQYMVT